MVDHGGDAATVIVNTTTDLTKGVLQISASGVKQLLLLLYEGKQVKIGEVNMEKLIKMLDSGDKINDVLIPAEHTKRVSELAMKHGVTYAVAEIADEKMIMYFPDSQSNRMNNVLKDIQNEINKGKENPVAEESKLEEKEAPNNEIQDPDYFKIRDSLYRENLDSKRTVVFFDGNNPNHYVRASQEPLTKGGCETRIFATQDGITELVSLDQASNDAYAFEKRMHFEVEGLYPESKIEEHINKVCTDLRNQEKAKEVIRDKENFIDNLLNKDSSLEGSIHTVFDANNRGNLIAIYKELKPFEGGEFKTVTSVMVFTDGQLNKDITPKQALLSYDTYKTMDKHGKSATQYLEKITSGELFEEKKNEKERNDPNQRKSLAEYEKDVEKIKATEAKKHENKESQSISPLNIVKDTMEVKER